MTDTGDAKSNIEFNHCSLSILPESAQGTSIQSTSGHQNSLQVASFAEPLSLVVPGGGLKQLDFSFDDTDFMFDSIFSGRQESNDSGYDTSEHAATSSESDASHAFVRVYSSDEAM